jgi:hypothetical protein
MGTIEAVRSGRMTVEQAFAAEDDRQQAPPTTPFLATEQEAIEWVRGASLGELMDFLSKLPPETVRDLRALAEAKIAANQARRRAADSASQREHSLMDSD